ncbi:MAG: hypothetical protein QOE76_3270 [Frankiales bacterium]|nr:hypothetical protein [Frankiales bacterium]
MDDPGLADAGVTAREAEVLDLLGDALSHAEIAARLVLSVRTVESHVAALRRKLKLDDHRSLVQLAVSRRGQRRAAARLPAPLTSFVGRTAELAELSQALREARLVTAVGPGGVGKTRLSIAAAQRMAETFPDGRWYVDLVPVTEAATLPAAIVGALGLAEASGRTPEQVLVTGIGDRKALLLLDNCEHLLDGVAMLTERLLTQCPHLVVLATSRIRMVVPHERVYRVPSLSVSPDGAGDATDLFRERATAAGGSAADTADLLRTATLCQALDGSALAIELAAARLPSLGWPALTAGLSDRMSLLAGGSRQQQRQQSLEQTLDWSYRLLTDVEQAVLRRVSVFATPFSAEAAQQICAFAEIEPAAVPAALGRLSDHNLMVPTTGADGQRWFALETIRQYGARQLEQAAEQEVYERHLRWCLETAARLDAETRDRQQWRVAFDAVADDLRAALGWAADRQPKPEQAGPLALIAARLLILRGRPAESQRRYESAASLTDDPAARAGALARAAAVAKCRVDAPAALRLERSAADNALAAGELVSAAVTTARAAELVSRFRGMFAEGKDEQLFDELMGRADELGGGHLRAEAAILSARANDRNPTPAGPTTVVQQALERAREAGDPVIESAALDALTLAQTFRHDIVAAGTTARQRVLLLADLPLQPEVALELKDALHVAVFTCLGAGDLPAALRYAQSHQALPFLQEEQHLAADELLAPYALSGRWHELDLACAVFADGWRAAGRPVGPGRALGPAAAAMVLGMRGDDAARREWLGILATMHDVDLADAGVGTGYGEVFDALLALHLDRPDEALRRLSAPATGFYGQVFSQWSAALTVEAAALTGTADESALSAAADAVAGNPVAAALVRRAAALAAGDRTGVIGTASAFEHAGCRYQSARTLLLAGGADREAGLLAMQALG